MCFELIHAEVIFACIGLNASGVFKYYFDVKLLTKYKKHATENC